MFYKIKSILILLSVVITFNPMTLQAGETVRIGALYPLSGGAAKSGTDTANAIRLAIEIVNNKQTGLTIPFANSKGLPALGNAKIDLIIADHQGSPEIGAAEAERLIVQKNVKLRQHICEC